MYIFTEKTFHCASTVWMCELEFQFIIEFTVEFSTKHHLLAICKHEIISRFGNIVPSSLCDGRVPRRASVACQLLFSDQIDIVWFNLFACKLFCLWIVVFIWWARAKKGIGWLFVINFVYFLLFILFMYCWNHMMGACQGGHRLLVSFYFLTRLTLFDSICLFVN